MDLRDLRYFETIAELEHMGQATERLHRSQPALSSCLRRLERECGAPLFDKDGRGIKLSAAGKVLLRWAQRLRLDVEDAQREVGDIGKGMSGQIRLGIVPTASQFLMPGAVRQLLKEAPDVTLKTVVALVDTLLPMLQSGQLDLVVGTEIQPQPGLASELIAEDLIVVAVHADHEILHGKPRLKDLLHYRWVLQPPGAPTRDWLDHAFDRAGLPRPHVQVESTLLLTLPSLIAETGLLSFISRHHLQDANGPVLLREVPLKETTMRRRMVVTRREASYLSPAARRLVALLTAQAGDARPPRPAAPAAASAQAGRVGRRPG